MHADLIPFVILSVLALFCAFLLKGVSKVLAGLFIVAGLVPLFCAMSNAERWPIPNWLELLGFYCSLPLLIAACLFAGTRRIPSGDKAIAFWISSLSAIGVSTYIALVIFALSNLPT
jgi:hypothetical protein